jgi:hypothetical protein
MSSLHRYSQNIYAFLAPSEPTHRPSQLWYSRQIRPDRGERKERSWICYQEATKLSDYGPQLRSVDQQVAWPDKCLFSHDSHRLSAITATHSADQRVLPRSLGLMGHCLTRRRRVRFGLRGGWNRTRRSQGARGWASGMRGKGGAGAASCVV